MGKQLVMYPEPEPTADERLNAAQAEMRREQMARDATKPDARERDRKRSRRHHTVRAKTISVKRMTKREREINRLLFPEMEAGEVERPKVRKDCQAGGVNGARPCPFVSCPHHLYLDVSKKTGAIKLNRPDLEVWEMPETCSLDVADRNGADGTTLEEVGRIMNLTRERIRQVEVKGLAKLQATHEMRRLRDVVDDGPPPAKKKQRQLLPVLEQNYEDSEDTFNVPFDVDAFCSDSFDSE